MSPRPYKLGRRQLSVDETRSRIVDAGLELLSAPRGPITLTVDAVARRADVSRMTVYHQFGSKQGLLVALFDGIRTRGQGERISAALDEADPLRALDTFIDAVATFRQAQRAAIRRLRAMTALDPDFDKVVREREEIGRVLQRGLVERVAARYGLPRPQTIDQVAAALHAVTSFEAFEDVAGDRRSFEDAVPVIRHMAHAVLGIADSFVGRAEPGHPLPGLTWSRCPSGPDEACPLPTRCTDLGLGGWMAGWLRRAVSGLFRRACEPRFPCKSVVDRRGVEPLTSAVQRPVLMS